MLNNYFFLLLVYLSLASHSPSTLAFTARHLQVEALLNVYSRFQPRFRKKTSVSQNYGKILKPRVLD
jgi:hypothetical protein